MMPPQLCRAASEMRSSYTWTRASSSIVHCFVRRLNFALSKNRNVLEINKFLGTLAIILSVVIVSSKRTEMLESIINTDKTETVHWRCRLKNYCPIWWVERHTPAVTFDGLQRHLVEFLRPLRPIFSLDVSWHWKHSLPFLWHEAALYLLVIFSFLFFSCVFILTLQPILHQCRLLFRIKRVCKWAVVKRAISFNSSELRIG